MALYKTLSSDDMANLYSQIEENEKHKQERRIAEQKQAVAENNKNDNGGIGGFLSNLVRDAKSAWNTLTGTAAAALSTPIQDMTKYRTESVVKDNTAALENIAKKYGYSSLDDAYDKNDGPEEMWKELQEQSKKGYQDVSKIGEDYKNNAVIKKVNETKQSQYGADALRTWNNLKNVLVPAAAATPLGGAVSGAIEGAADTLEKADGTVLDLEARGSDGKIGNTENTSIDTGDLLKNVAVGAGAGAATGAIGGKIGNAKSAIGSRILNNKVITSGAGRGALLGAIGGGLGAGANAAIEGGDILGATLQGTGSGALTGGVMGAASSGINKAKNAAIDKLGLTDQAQALRDKFTYNQEQQTQPEVGAEAKTPQQLQEATTDEVGVDYTKPIDYQGNELKIEKKNALQKLGGNLSKVGEKIDNAELYNALNSKTANQIVKNKTVQELRKLGYNPEDYGEVAKVSTTTNRFVDDLVKNSGASVVDNGLVDRLTNPENGSLPITPQLRKEYTQEVRKTLDTIEKGDMPGKYSAKDLWGESRRIGKIANKYYQQSKNANGGDNANERGILADALMDVKYELRNLASKSVDGFGDKYTKSQLAQRLKNLGANDKVVADMMEANNIGEMVRKTAKYEDARQMAFEMETNEYKRNAISGSKSNANPVNRVAQDSGAGELVSVVTRPIGKGVGKAAKVAGNLISGAGDLIAGKGANLNTSPIPTATPLNAGEQAWYNRIGRRIGETEGYDASSNAIRDREYKNLESQLAADQASTEAYYAPAIRYYEAQAQQEANPMQAQLSDIANGMNLALAAGDIDSYNKLASLYKTAYSMYELQNPTSKTSEIKLSDTQKKANSAMDLLNELEGMKADFGYSVKDIPGLNLVNIGGNNYANTADALASELGYMLSGATIKDDELQKIKDEYIPQPFDSEENKQAKLRRARNIIQRYQAGTTADTQA